MHPSKRAQIAYLKADKTFTKVPSKYTDFTDVCLPKLAVELSKYTRINNHTIELVDDRQPLYGLIYSQESIELETLKAYIKNNLTNSFMRPSKSLAEVPIFFNKNPNSSLRLCIDYESFNNLTIKNQYLLSLVRESLD